MESLTINEIYKQTNLAAKGLAQAFRVLITEEQIKQLGNLADNLNCVNLSPDNKSAMAPSVHINKKIDVICPHKTPKRGKFKRTSRNK